MTRTNIIMEDYLYDFFKKVADYTGIKSAEEVMVDALENVAAELTEKMSGNRTTLMA